MYKMAGKNCEKSRVSSPVNLLHKITHETTTELTCRLIFFYMSGGNKIVNHGEIHKSQLAAPHLTKND